MFINSYELLCYNVTVFYNLIENCMITIIIMINYSNLYLSK